MAKRKKSRVTLIEKILIALGVTALPAKVCSLVKTHNVESNDTLDVENTVGFEDIGIKYNFKVHSNNFIILHVKNNGINDITKLREQLSKCNEMGISVGLVLDTDATDLYQMYQDVDFLQAIIKEYDIDLPVYCNIDNIMTNKSLNNSQKTTLISSFIDKANRSDMYLGLYGTDSNLCDCKEYEIYDITNYDCFVVQDSDVIKYDGTATITKDLEGNIKASRDLSELITSKGFNSSTKLVKTALYTVQEGENIHTLALRFGLSDEDLMKYNNIKKEINVGDTIYIPNLYRTINQETHEVNYSYAIARGIDISDYQTNINWERIVETSDYVIVEVARDSMSGKEMGSFVDTCIEQVVNTVKNDLGLGLYFCITKDMKVSDYEVRLETYLNTFDNYLNILGFKLDRENIPVFMDFEIYSETNDYYKLMEVFDRVCSKHGFCKIGLYGNKSTLDQIGNSLYKGDEKISIKDTGWYIWKAGGPQYSAHENTSQDDLKLDEIVEIKNESYQGYTPVMQQVTNVCTDTGASNSMNHCDVSFLYEYEVFGDEFRIKLVGEEVTDPYEDLVSGSLDVDLRNYPNVPVNKIISIVDTTISSLYAILAITVIGTRLHFKLKRKRNKTLTKKK